MANLTNKQRLFLEAYLTCWNATEAARQAGYANPNMAGPRLMVNDGIAAAIKERLAEKAMPADEVLARLTQQARGDIRDLFKFDEAGEIAGLNLSRSAPLHLIKSITPTRYGTKIELHDAQAALVQLGRHHGLFVDKIAPTDPTGQREYADTTLDALKERLIAQLTAGPAGVPARSVPPEPDTPGNGGVAL